jgi:putative spermidine/putrescine transport system permease protein
MTAGKGAGPKLGPGCLIVPGLVVLAAIFVFPLLLLLSRSIFDPDLTLHHYTRIFERAEYLKVIWISVEIAVVSTALTILLAYPASYYLTKAPPAVRNIFLALVLIPFWTNILVRCYSWMILLQKRGIINTVLVQKLSIFDQPLDLVYNYAGVIIGMVHYLLPPAILILYSINQTIDRRLVQAAESLGAPPLRAFYRVFFPLSMPGVRAATVLVFILSLGFFVTPALLGGRREITMAMLVNTQFSELINWGFGSALSVVLLVMTLAGIVLYYRSMGRRGIRLGEA